MEVFDGGLRAVDHVSFGARPGGFVSIVGPIPLTEGRIPLDGRPDTNVSSEPTDGSPVTVTDPITVSPPT